MAVIDVFNVDSAGLADRYESQSDKGVKEASRGSLP